MYDLFNPAETAPSAVASTLKALPAKVTYSIELIGPETAQQYLALNTENRPLRPTHVNRMAQDMRDGKWNFTGEPICFREGDGVLMNGQHRLHAVIASGETVQFMVVRGLAEDAWATMDRGMKRTTGDEFSRLGVSNATQAAAATRLLHRYFNAEWSKDYRSDDAELSRFYAEEHPGLMDHLPQARRFCNEVPIPMSVANVALYLSHLADVSRVGLDIQQWEEQVILGVGSTSSDSPALQLRRNLARRKQRNQRTPQRLALGLYARAWTAWVQGKPVQLLRFADTDAFPRIEWPFKRSQLKPHT